MSSFLNIFNFAPPKFSPSHESSKSDADGDYPDDTDSQLPRQGRSTTARRNKGRSRGQVLKDLTLEEELRKLQSEQQLSEAERAFLPIRVRNVLLELGTVPVTPMAATSRGAVLFVDISGFTQLGRELRAKNPPLEAASMLAQRIIAVLHQLTAQCQLYEGDVAKFAGDALLCVWDMTDETAALERAKSCAVAMLKMVKQVDPSLDLHGGIAVGSLMHFHLGDKRHELRWYLLTGEAVSMATNLVEESARGTIHCLAPNGAREILTVNTKSKLVFVSQDSSSNLDPSSSSPVVSRPRVNTIDDPFLNLVITYKGRAYIPKLLRNILAGGRFETGGGELRNHVAILFATLPELYMEKDEVKQNQLSDDRMRLLNDTFVDMATIVHAFDGEVRDLLFDDKGCVFIAVFGAYGAVEMPELKAAKAAMRMRAELEVEKVQLGVSVGTCFVGLAGDDRRHDFVVMGHEVNMAARYMGKADDILVSEKIQDKTKEFFAFESREIVLKKARSDDEDKHESGRGLGSQRSFHKLNDLSGENDDAGNDSSKPATVADPNGKVLVYRPKEEISRRPSFMATYRYTQMLNDKFVGRKTELKKIEAHLMRTLKDKAAGTLSVTGPRGYGKTALIMQVRRLMDEKFVSTMGTAFELESDTPFYVFRQIIESLFGLFETMPGSKAKTIIEGWKKEKVTVDYDTLELMLPYISKLVSPPPSKEQQPKPIRGGMSMRSSVVGRLVAQGANKLSMRAMDTDKLREALAEGSGGGDGFPGEEGEIGPPGELERQSSSRSASRPGGRTSRRASGGADEGRDSGGKLAAALRAEEERPASISRARRAVLSVRGLVRQASTSGGLVRQASGGNIRSTVASSVKIDEEVDKKKKERLRRKQSRGANQHNVLRVKQLEQVAALVLALVGLAAQTAAKTGKKGLLIVFEDSQWLDTSSLQVLEVIFERIHDQPKTLPGVCILVSGRTHVSSDDESGGGPIMMPGGQKDMRKLLESRVLERLVGVKQSLCIALEELSRGDVDAIVCSVLERHPGETVSKEVLDAIFRNSGGMPNAIAHILELIMPPHDGKSDVKPDSGSIVLDPKTNQWRWRPETNAVEAVLHAARAAFVARIDNLSLETKDILKVAAMICDSRQRFRLHDLVQVIEADLATKSRYVKASHAYAVTEPRLAYHLQPALNFGLIKYSRGFVSSAEEWAFASSAIAEAVLEMIPIERQREIEELASTLGKEHLKHEIAGLQQEFVGLGI